MKGTALFKKLLVVGLAAAIVVAVLSTGANAAAAAPGYDVTRAGATGTDSIEDTWAIQSALDEYDSVYIPDGVYYINADKSLQLKSNQTLILSGGATLQALPSAQDRYAVLRISNVSNVTVTGGKIIGDRTVHKGTSGEWGHGILVGNGSENITLSNLTITNCWGDGIYLGSGASIVRNVEISGVICDNNRRQGLSVTGAAGVTVTDCTFKNTNGTAPESGIDIEPYGDYTASDITIVNTTCTGNTGSGLIILGGKYTIHDVSVLNSTFSGNKGMGIAACNASGLKLTDSVITDNLFGIDFPNDISDVVCAGLTVTDNRLLGVSLVTAHQNKGVGDITFESSTFTNNSQMDSGRADGIKIGRYDATGYIRNVTFRDCRFVDDQTSKTQRFGLSVDPTGSGLSNIVVERSCVFDGNIAGGYLGSNALKIL